MACWHVLSELPSAAKVVVNDSAINWVAVDCLDRGSNDVLQHFNISQCHKYGKLTLMLALSRLGWEGRHGGLECSYYSVGSPKVFDMSPSRPKAYLVCMCKADDILSKWATDDGDLAILYHGMVDGYYRAALMADTPAAIEQFMQIVNSVDDASELKQKDFDPMLKDKVEAADEDVGRANDDCLPMLLDYGTQGALDSDCVVAQRVATQVCRAIRAEMVDFRSHMRGSFHGHEIIAHFDKFSHSSGHPWRVDALKRIRSGNLWQLGRRLFLRYRRQARLVHATLGGCFGSGLCPGPGWLERARLAPRLQIS